MNSNVDQYSDVLNEDFRAVNDQLNVVLLLFIDRVDQLEHPQTRTIYEDISDEDIEESIQGKVTLCTNRGVVQGDINIGGVAGSMSIDEEEPEENAAGSVEFSLGNTYLTKCILSDSKNYGYVTVKKDGAGCVAGYMNLGVVSGCEAYGGAVSTEGDYVGGIAGYADAVNNCYSMSEIQAASGRAGSIAGQAASREDEELLLNIKDNYYVEDELFGIDDISYVGVAEPITYQELLTVEGLPVDYRHLKVTFVAEDKLLGTQELKYAESLNSLKFPELKDKDNTNGVWPDVSGRRMKGNLVLAAEYEENITVVSSEEKEEGTGKSIVYDITLENGKPDTKVVSLRLYNKGNEEAAVWQYIDNEWIRLESKVRGQYIQFTMKGTKGTFCVASGKAEGMLRWFVIGASPLQL